MTRWLISLYGETTDLEELPIWFPDGEFFAFSEGTNYFITGGPFEHIEDHKKVRELAATVLDKFCTVGFLLMPMFQRPTLGHVYRENDDGTRFEFPCPVTSDSVQRYKARGNESVQQGSTRAQVLLQGIDVHPALRDATQIWADPVRTWPRLYRVFEAIDSYMKETGSAAELYPQSERARFTRTANSAEVAGKDSRHSGGKFDPPLCPMSLDEAKDFVGNLLAAALLMASAERITKSVM